MIARLKPPLVVMIVGRPKSKDWSFPNESGKGESSFSDDLFRCLSYEIGNPHAGNPALPVYFLIGDFDQSQETAPPPLLSIPQAQRVLVIVLLDSGFLEDPVGWKKFFNKMSDLAQKARQNFRFLPMARTDDLGSPYSLKRLGLVDVLGTAAPVCLPIGDERYSHLGDVARFFRISAMVAAINALIRGDSIEVFISYARRDGKEVANQLRKAFEDHSGIKPLVDSKMVSPNGFIDGMALEQRVAVSTCVVFCQTVSFADRVWCQREALMAKKADVPMIVVDLHEGLKRRDCESLTQCPHLRLNGGIDGHCEEVVELAVSEILRMAHHKDRCAASLASAGIDPRCVEVLVRPPDLVRMIDVAAHNKEASRTNRPSKDLILHPEPPLREHELEVLKSCHPSLSFLTPGTLHAATAATPDC